MKPADRFENFSPYTPIEPFEVLSARLGRCPQEIIKLDANENPYGPAQAVKTALGNLPFPHIYPDPESRELRTALSQFCSIPSEYIMVGAGADELIDLLLRVVLEPGDAVINCPPTFGMYDFDTRLNFGTVINVERKEDFSLNMPDILKKAHENQAKIIFITSPNNPDGSLISRQDLNTLLSLPALVVLDEAYIEFTADKSIDWDKNSAISLVPQYENLIVLRTFSKWAGLAGLRVGYGAFPQWLLPTLWKAKQPYNVNVAANCAALVSLQNLTELEHNVQKIRAERQNLFQLLKQIPYCSPFPSSANFILCQVNGKDAFELKQNLLSQGILIRYYQNPRLQNMIRISVGTPDQTHSLIQVLENLL